MTLDRLAALAGTTADELSAALRREHITVTIVLSVENGAWASATRGDRKLAIETLHAVADDVENQELVWPSRPAKA
jgi:hypothetical protein